MQRVIKLSGRNIRWSKSETSGVWSITIATEQGDRTISTKETDKRKAVEMVRELKLHWLNTDRFQSKVFAALQGCRKITIAGAIDLWFKSRLRTGSIKESSAAMYATYLRAFGKQCGLMKEQPSVINEEHVNKFINANDGTKANTRRIRLTALKLWFDWLIAERYAITNYPRSIGRINMTTLSHDQKEPTRKIPFTDEEIEKLQGYIRNKIAEERAKLSVDIFDGDARVPSRIASLEFWSSAVIISRNTGLRLSDVVTLEKSCFLPDTLAVWTKKRDRRVAIPMNSELRNVYERHSGGSDARLFPHQTTESSALSTQFARILKDAGIEERSFHCLRSTFERHAVDQFIAAGMVMEQAIDLAASMCGHSVDVAKEHYL